MILSTYGFYQRDRAAVSHEPASTICCMVDIARLDIAQAKRFRRIVYGWSLRSAQCRIRGR